MIAVSAAAAEVVRASYRVPPDKVAVILNGADDAFLAQESNAHVTTTARYPRRRLVTVARLYPVKGVDIFLDAAALVIPHFPDLEVHIVGDGPMRPSLEQRATALGIASSVTFHGRLASVGAQLLSSDVFVLSSRSEGLGIAAIEAMAASKPVVASAVGGLSEVVADGQTGFLVDLRRDVSGELEPDPAAIAKAIVHLFSNPELALSMGRAGRARYEERFTVRGFVENYQAAYSGRKPASRAPLCGEGRDNLE